MDKEKTQKVETIKSVELTKAIQTKHILEIKSLFKEFRTNLDGIKDENGRSLILAAVELGRVELVRYLVNEMAVSTSDPKLLEGCNQEINSIILSAQESRLKSAEDVMLGDYNYAESHYSNMISCAGLTDQEYNNL
jgi:hypothetical protein